jgi:hypothetical protein
MDYILVKFANFLIAICVASMVALTLGFVAHYHFGLSLSLASAPWGTPSSSSSSISA